MKTVNIPITVYETGDKVITPDGVTIVLHDELDGFDGDHSLEESPDGIAVALKQRAGIVVEAGTGDAVWSRDKIRPFTAEEVIRLWEELPAGYTLDRRTLPQLRIILSYEMLKDGSELDIVEDILNGKVFETKEKIIHEFVHTFGY